MNKISYINIDSRFRNNNKANIKYSSYEKLNLNPIILKGGTNSIFIKLTSENNNYKIGDKISIKGLSNGRESYLLTNIKIQKNTKFIKIKCNKNLLDNVINITSDLYIFIEKYKYNTVISNDNDIINSINLYGDYKIKALVNSNIIDNEYEYLLEGLNINNENYEFNNIKVHLTKLYVGNIPIYYINTNNYISNDNINIFHTIVNKNNNILEINIKKKIDKDYECGKNNIIIEKILEYKEFNDSTNNYTIQLPKLFKNISKIELISFELEEKLWNTNKIIINDTNNHLIIRLLDKKLNIFIYENNYNINDLILSVNQSIKEVLFSNNIFDINIDFIFVNNKFVFNFYKLVNIKSIAKLNINNKNLIKIEFDGNVTVNKLFNKYIKIISKNKIIDVYSLSNCNISNILNHNSEEFKNEDFNKYIFCVPLETSENITNENIDMSEFINCKLPFYEAALDLTNDNSFGKIIGFDNIGNDTSITINNYNISSITPYCNQTKIIHYLKNNRININKLENIQYFFININNYENIITHISSNIFAKILLSKKNNNFICTPYIPDNHIVQLDSLDINLLNSNGELMNTYETNHSFTLAITEILENN